MLLLTSLFFSNPALAVPVQLNQHGRLLDSNNTPVDGIHVLAFRLYDSQLSGTMLWEEGLQVTFVNGYYSVVLGGNTASNPLNDTVLKTQPLYLELEIDGEGPIGLRQEIVSAPYARLAGTATHVDGGTVNASELSIGGNLVVDSSGSWVGETMIISWGDITGIPSDLTDGDDNTQLSEQEVETMITNAPIDLSAGTTLNGNDILTSADTLSADWNNITNVPQSIQDGDDNTQLSEQEVEDMITNAPVDLSAGTTLNGNDILTSADTLSADWNNITNVPQNIKTETTTHSFRTRVEDMITNAPIDLSAGTTLNGNDILTSADPSADWNNITNVPQSIKTETTTHSF